MANIKLLTSSVRGGIYAPREPNKKWEIAAVYYLPFLQAFDLIVIHV